MGWHHRNSTGWLAAHLNLFIVLPSVLLLLLAVVLLLPFLPGFRRVLIARRSVLWLVWVAASRTEAGALLRIQIRAAAQGHGPSKEHFGGGFAALDEYLARRAFLERITIFVQAPLEVQVAEFLVAVARVVADVVRVTTASHLRRWKIFRVDRHSHRATAIRRRCVKLVFSWMLAWNVNLELPNRNQNFPSLQLTSGTFVNAIFLNGRVEDVVHRLELLWHGYEVLKDVAEDNFSA